MSRVVSTMLRIVWGCSLRVCFLESALVEARSWFDSVVAITTAAKLLRSLLRRRVRLCFFVR